MSKFNIITTTKNKKSAKSNLDTEGLTVSFKYGSRAPNNVMYERYNDIGMKEVSASYINQNA